MYNYPWKANSSASGICQRVPLVLTIFPAEVVQGADIVRAVMHTLQKGRIQTHARVGEACIDKFLSFFISKCLKVT